MQQSPLVVSKLLNLTKRGSDFPERLRNKIGVWVDSFSSPAAIDVIQQPSMIAAEVGRIFNASLSDLTSRSFDLVEDHLRNQRLRPSAVPFGDFHNGSRTLGSMCYFVSRCLQPNKVVETGVAHGVTSTYILQALADNARGTLHSIDLPPLMPKAEKYLGTFIPLHLRDRWRLTTGSSRKVLPDILKTAGAIDLFVHDSLHTYSHMKWELETALRSLRPGGVIIADDIEGNRAFEECARHPSIAACLAIRQEGKNAVCGLLRTRS